MLAAILFAPRRLAVRAIEAWLGGHGAPSAIEVLSLSDTGLTARVRVGDPRDPDLTIDRMELGYSVAGFWNGKPFEVIPSSVRLVRPRLKLRLIGGRLDFGRLNGVVGWARRQPPSGRHLPDLTIVDGQVVLVTPGGKLAVSAAGKLIGGRSGLLDGRVEPFRQRRRGYDLASTGGPLRLSADGRRLSVSLSLGAGEVRVGESRVTADGLSLAGDLPFPVANGVNGPAHLNLAVVGVSSGPTVGQLRGGRLTAAMDGSLTAGGDRQRFTGVLSARANAAASSISGLSVTNAGADVDLVALTLLRVRSGLSVDARGHASFQAGRAEIPGGAIVTGLLIETTMPSGRLSWAANTVAGRATLTGRGYGRGRLPAAQAARLARAIPVISGQRPYASAASAALREFSILAPNWRLDVGPRSARLALVTAARIDAGSGARLALSGHAAASLAPIWRANGAAYLSVGGGGLPAVIISSDQWSATSAALEARLAIQAGFTVDPVEDAAMNLRGDLRQTSGGWRFDLAECATVAAMRARGGGGEIANPALRVCPDSAPLVESDGGGWRARGRVEGLRMDANGPGVALRDGDFAFVANGSRSGLASANLSLRRAVVGDISSAPRFRPLTLAGALHLDGGQLDSQISITGSTGVRLGRATVSRSAPGGSGQFSIDLDGLDFTAGGLQPADLTPIAAAARDASGRVRFGGWVRWGPRGIVESGGDLEVRRLAFTGPIGPVEDVDGVVHFSSLIPPKTPADQKITAGGIRSVLPVSDLLVLFDLDVDRLHIQRVSASVAGGALSVDPMTIPLSSTRSVDGALVLQGIDVEQVLEATNLSNAVKLQAKVDGRIPFHIAPNGLTIHNGSLSAIGGGRLSISRTALTGGGAAVAADAQEGLAQDWAYQALTNLRFDTLDATLDSQPHDRLGVVFHIRGRHDPPTPARAELNLLDVLRGRAFSKPVPLPSGTEIDLTLDTSLNFGELVDALAGAWRDALKPAARVDSGERVTGTVNGRTEHP